MTDEVIINHAQLIKLLGNPKLSSSFQVFIQRHMTKSVKVKTEKTFECRGRQHTTIAPQKHWYVEELLSGMCEVRVSSKPSLWQQHKEFIYLKLTEFLEEQANV